MLRFATLLALFLAPAALAEGPLSFRVTYPADKFAGPFTGRVHLMLLKADTKALGGGPNWFRPEPGFVVRVKDVKPGEVIVIDKTAHGHPFTLDKLPKGTYTVQAVLDRAANSRSFSHGPGNLYAIKRMELDPATTGEVALTLDRVWEERKFPETARVKLVDIESKLLTDFHKRPTRLRAGVALPADYAKDATAKYPAIYEIPGFGGNHFAASPSRTKIDGLDVLHVMLDPECHHGHHVFADSANNGPVGQALIEELIPAIEKRFRANGKRVVTGHSSGGWSSLWLQVTYPETFLGVWSTAPDPIDFRDFQKIDVYAKGENMFTDAKGERRPIARIKGKPALWYKDFSDMETVMGHGGQLASFEAVFSERDKDGEPRKLWDRKTGALDPVTAKSWEKYDIRMIVEKNWSTLAPKLKGKLHVYMGDEDTFYLEGATVLLKKSLEGLGSDAKVELFKGKDHGSLMTAEMRSRIAKEMAATLRAAK